MFAMLMKETRPFAFFGALGTAVMAASLVFMTPVLIEFFETGLVPRMPTWVLSMALMMIAFILYAAGVILDSVARARAELLRLHYVNLPAARAGVSEARAAAAQADRAA